VDKFAERHPKGKSGHILPNMASSTVVSGQDPAAAAEVTPVLVEPLPAPIFARAKATCAFKPVVIMPISRAKVAGTRSKGFVHGGYILLQETPPDGEDHFIFASKKMVSGSCLNKLDFTDGLLSMPERVVQRTVEWPKHGPVRCFIAVLVERETPMPKVNGGLADLCEEYHKLVKRGLTFMAIYKGILEKLPQRMWCNFRFT